MTIGERIRALRKEKGLTQKALGDKCGMADSAIRRYESGRGNPTEKTLQRIADALGISFAELIDVRITYDDDGNIAGAVGYEASMRAFLQGAYDKLNNSKLVDPPSLVTGDKMEDSQVYRLQSSFNKLNAEGQQKAVERVEELTEIPKYQRKSEAE